MPSILPLIALGLLIAGSLVGSEPADQNAVAGIVSALRSHEFARAEQLAAQALAKSPQDIRLLTMRGMALSGLGRDTEALAAYRDALQISPAYVPALEGAAQLEYKTGSKAAFATLDRLLQIRPDEQTAHAMRAMLAHSANDCDTAVQHFERSGSIIDNQPAALYAYGACLVKLKRADDATSVFQRLVTLRPSDHRARCTLAAVQLMSGRAAEALSTLQPALDGNPDSRVLDLAAASYEAAGNTPQAVATLRQAILRAPRDEQLYAHFASLSFTHKSFQVGVDMVTAGLKQIPDSAKLYLARGVLYVQLAQYDKADQDFAVAERLDPAQTDAASARALAQYQNSDPATALATIRAQMKNRPSDEFLYYLLAEILSRRGATPGSPEFQQAIDAAKHAVDLRPNFPLARDVLSRLYLNAGDVDLAIEQCRLALRDDATDTTALYRLIRALQKKGTPDARKEVPALLKRFADVRRQLQQQEQQESRYRLIEASPDSQPQH